jgi:hypothetical protein
LRPVPTDLPDPRARLPCPHEDGTATPAYRTVDLYFPDYDTAGAAVTTAEAAALFPSIFGLATGGLRTAFADIEES